MQSLLFVFSFAKFSFSTLYMNYIFLMYLFYIVNKDCRYIEIGRDINFSSSSIQYNIAAHNMHIIMVNMNKENQNTKKKEK